MIISAYKRLFLIVCLLLLPSQFSCLPLSCLFIHFSDNRWYKKFNFMIKSFSFVTLKGNRFWQSVYLESRYVFWGEVVDGCWKADGPVVCRRKFNFDARRGAVSSLWMSRKRLPGRFCPFINFDQIFTVHHMVCLTSHSHFSRPGFEQFGAICVPFGWTRAISQSAGPCWCLWDPATWETGSTQS